MMIGGQTDRLWYRIGMCIERDLPQFGRLIHEDPLLKEMAARNALPVADQDLHRDHQDGSGTSTASKPSRS